MKPDIVLFGEPLPPAVATCVAADVRPGAADLVLVVGTSLAVAPVSTLPARFPAGVPRVLLNRTPVVPPGGAFDYVALGDCDAIGGGARGGSDGSDGDHSGCVGRQGRVWGGGRGRGGTGGAGTPLRRFPTSASGLQQGQVLGDWAERHGWGVGVGAR